MMMMRPFMKEYGRISVVLNWKGISTSSQLLRLTIVRWSHRFLTLYGSEETSWLYMTWQESPKSKSLKSTNRTTQMRSFTSLSQKYFNISKKKRLWTKSYPLCKETTKKCPYISMKKYSYTGKYTITSKTVIYQKAMKNWRIFMICYKWGISSCLISFSNCKKSKRVACWRI